MFRNRFFWGKLCICIFTVVMVSGCTNVKMVKNFTPENEIKIQGKNKRVSISGFVFRDRSQSYAHRCKLKFNEKHKEPWNEQFLGILEDSFIKQGFNPKVMGFSKKWQKGISDVNDLEFIVDRIFRDTSDFKVVSVAVVTNFVVDPHSGANFAKALIPFGFNVDRHATMDLKLKVVFGVYDESFDKDKFVKVYTVSDSQTVSYDGGAIERNADLLQAEINMFHDLELKAIEKFWQDAELWRSRD